MKLHYLSLSKNNSLLLLLSLGMFSSCIVYQDAPDDDGIYSKRNTETRVIVAESKEHKDYEQDYFTKELERYDKINGTDILTDIENYSSYNDTIPNENIEENDIDYAANRSWGYNDGSDVVVNINLNTFDPWYGNPYWGWGYGYGWGGFYNPWWGGPYWGGSYWGWNSWYWGTPGWGWGGGWYRPYPYYRTNRYAYNNVRYGRRTASNNLYNRRVSSSRRVSSVYRDRDGNVVSRRNTTSSRTRRGTTIQNSSRRRTTSVNNNSTTSRRRNSNVNRNSDSSSRRNNSYRNSSNSRRSSSFSRSSSMSRGRSSGGGARRSSGGRRGN